MCGVDVGLRFFRAPAGCSTGSRLCKLVQSSCTGHGGVAQRGVCKQRLRGVWAQITAGVALPGGLNSRRKALVDDGRALAGGLRETSWMGSPAELAGGPQAVNQSATSCRCARGLPAASQAAAPCGGAIRKAPAETGGALAGDLNATSCRCVRVLSAAGQAAASCGGAARKALVEDR